MICQEEFDRNIRIPLRSQSLNFRCKDFYVEIIAKGFRIPKRCFLKKNNELQNNESMS